MLVSIHNFLCSRKRSKHLFEFDFLFFLHKIELLNIIVRRFYIQILIYKFCINCASFSENSMKTNVFESDSFNRLIEKFILKIHLKLFHQRRFLEQRRIHIFKKIKFFMLRFIWTCIHYIKKPVSKYILFSKHFSNNKRHTKICNTLQLLLEVCSISMLRKRCNCDYKSLIIQIKISSL